MARSLADPLYERLLTSFPPTQDYTRADWDSDEMPAPVAHFLGHLLDHNSRREARRLRRARTDWVDYEHPEMEAAVRTFFEAVNSHTRVPAQEWEDSLRRATRHATAHLVQPVHVLADFVYAESEEPLPLSRVLWRMDFFGPYAYLRKAVHAFAEKHALDTLGPDRFTRFLRRIDERITSDYDADRWLRLLEPLFATAQRATGTERVPPALLQAFFEEKGQRAIKQRLARLADEGHEGVSPRALRRLLKADEGRSPDAPGTTDARPGTPSPDSAQAGADEHGAEEDEDFWGRDGGARPADADPPDQTPDEDDSVPLWQQFQEGRTESASTDSPSGPPDDKDSEQPLWARFQQDRSGRLSDAVADAESGSPPPSDSDPPSVPDASGPADQQESSSSAPNKASRSRPSTDDPSSNLEDLERQALGTSNPPHRAVYVRQLFDGDQADYQRILRRLADTDNWNEASQIIASDVFRKHKVNIYSDAAVHFTNTVEDRFRNE